MSLLILNADDVRRLLTYDVCIPLMKQAMSDLAADKTQQLLRQAIRLNSGKGLFGIMPGAMGANEPFGAKLVGIYKDAAAHGRPSHQGAVVLFDPETGGPVAVLNANEITAIRTASASAAATDVMARPDARRLAVLGLGEQGEAHIAAVRLVRPLEDIVVWGRDRAKAEAFAEKTGNHLGVTIRVVDTVKQAADGADIICTTTGASEPILFSADVADGTHLNIVGSSLAGPTEIDNALVVRSRYIADHTPSVLPQGAEFIHARDAGLIDESHIVADIGEVFLGRKVGRETPEQVTLYKSVGNVVQDLSSAWWLYHAAKQQGAGVDAPF
jgi:ornithine cyclodeaminase/alanine dehydrogenase-like protein (mu-crystallin family)